MVTVCPVVNIQNLDELDYTKIENLRKHKQFDGKLAGRMIVRTFSNLSVFLIFCYSTVLVKLSWNANSSGGSDTAYLHFLQFFIHCSRCLPISCASCFFCLFCRISIYIFVKQFRQIKITKKIKPTLFQAISEVVLTNAYVEKNVGRVMPLILLKQNKRTHGTDRQLTPVMFASRRHEKE